MDLDGIRLFVLAADMLNISAAGRKLGLAPAVASARLAKLEKSLGADLLHRSTRKVTISLEGEEFLPFAREILAQASAARAALGMGNTTATGTLRFTASSTFFQLYIAPLLPEFLALHPGVNLDLHLSDIQFNLIEGSFDLALRNAPLEITSLKCRKLADDRRILCASPIYLAKHGAPRHPSELSHHQLIAFQNTTPKKLRHIDDGSIEYFSPQGASGRITLDDGASQKYTTVAGAGISINSLWSVHQELAHGSLVRVLPKYEAYDKSVLWLAYPKSNVLTTKVRVFIDFLVEKIGTSPAWLS